MQLLKLVQRRIHAVKHIEAMAYERDTHADTALDYANLENFTSSCQTLINDAQEIVGLLHNYQLGVGDLNTLVSKIMSMLRLRVGYDGCGRQAKTALDLVEGKITV